MSRFVHKHYYGDTCFQSFLCSSRYRRINIPSKSIILRRFLFSIIFLWGIYSHINAQEQQIVLAKTNFLESVQELPAGFDNLIDSAFENFIQSQDLFTLEVLDEVIPRLEPESPPEILVSENSDSTTDSSETQSLENPDSEPPLASENSEILSSSPNLHDISELNLYPIILIPEAEEYEVISRDDGTRQVELKGYFYIYQNGIFQEQFLFQAIGLAENESISQLQILSDITEQLGGYLRTLDGLPLFILERNGQVVFFTDKEGSPVAGDEYAVIQQNATTSVQENELPQTVGIDGEVKIGLLRVREVNEGLVSAEIVFENTAIESGMRLQKLLRLPFSITPIIRSGIELGSTTVGFGGLSTAVKLAWNYGLYNFRPVVEVDLLFPPSLFTSGTGLSFVGKVGAEFQFSLGRVSLLPQILIGAGIGTKKDGSFGLISTENNLGLALTILPPTPEEFLEIYLELNYLIRIRTETANPRQEFINFGAGVRIR